MTCISEKLEKMDTDIRLALFHKCAKNILEKLNKYKNIEIIKTNKIFDILKNKNMIFVEFTHSFEAYNRSSNNFAKIKIDLVEFEAELNKNLNDIEAQIKSVEVPQKYLKETDDIHLLFLNCLATPIKIIKFKECNTIEKKCLSIIFKILSDNYENFQIGLNQDRELILIKVIKKLKHNGEIKSGNVEMKLRIDFIESCEARYVQASILSDIQNSFQELSNRK
jgi:hypothetical protein